jgi:hypothetical protein
MKHIQLFEQFIAESFHMPDGTPIGVDKNHEPITEAKETVEWKGSSYTVDFIKTGSSSKPSWHLLLIDSDDKKIYAWPNVFSYYEGWTQGMGRSQKMYFLTTKEYGSVSQGDGRTSQGTPRFIDRQLEYIVRHWKGDGYSRESTKWYQSNVKEFPKGTKKDQIKTTLDY